MVEKDKRVAVGKGWFSNGGVLMISYELLRRLMEQNDPLWNELFVSPGPDLVVVDEGHRIKNENAAISKALKSIGTRRRVCLTGYPLQNNLDEYWCMIDFVRPGLLGEPSEFRARFCLF